MRFMLAFDHASVVSSMRFEKPHSLSYQAHDLHERAVDHLGQRRVVDRRARIVVEVDRDQRRRRCSRGCPSARPRLASFIDRVDLLIAGRALRRRSVRSTTDTLIVGTRIEKPSSLPLSSGSTRPTAAAAPVLVGICDMRGRARAAQVLVEDVGRAPGRWCTRGSWSSGRARCRSSRAAPWPAAPGSWSCTRRSR